MVLRRILNKYYLCKINTNCDKCPEKNAKGSECKREMCIINSVILGPVGERQMLLLNFNGIKKKEGISFITNKEIKFLEKKEGDYKELKMIDFDALNIKGEQSLSNLKILNESVLKKRDYHNKAKINYISDTQIEVIYNGKKDIIPITTIKEENQNG